MKNDTSFRPAWQEIVDFSCRRPLPLQRLEHFDGGAAVHFEPGPLFEIGDRRLAARREWPLVRQLRR